MIPRFRSWLSAPPSADDPRLLALVLLALAAAVLAAVSPVLLWPLSAADGAVALAPLLCLLATPLLWLGWRRRLALALVALQWLALTTALWAHGMAALGVLPTYLLAVLAASFAGQRRHGLAAAVLSLVVVAAAPWLAGAALPIGPGLLPAALLWLLAAIALLGLVVRHGLAAQRELAASENRLRALMGCCPEIMVVLDQQGRVTFTSPAAERALGRVVLGLQALDFIHPGDRATFAAFLSTVADSAEPREHTFRAFNAQGSWCWVAVTAVGALAEPGVEGFILSFHDVSQQRAAEQAFRESEQRYAAVVEAIAEGIIVVDADLRVVLCNTSAAAIFGTTVEAILACSPRAAPQVLTHRDGSPIGLDAQPAFITLRTGQPCRHAIIYFQGDAGQRRVISVNTEPICRPGEPLPYMVVCSLSDITESREASEALQVHASRLEFLHQTDRAILASQVPEELARSVLEQIRRMVPCDRAAVALIHPGERELQILSIAADVPTDDLVGARLPVGGCQFETILTYGMISIIDDLQASYDGEQTLAHLYAAGIRSCMTVTLFANDELIGLVHLSSSQPRAFQHDQGSLVVELANHLAIGLQNARLFAQVTTANQRLRSLSRQLMGAQETERRRIARELHDEIGQALALIKLNIRAVQRMALADDVALRLEQSLGIIEETLLRVRRMALDLRPAMLDDLGLASVLRWYVDQQARLADLEAHFDLPEAPPRLPTEIETACFRVVQEALANTVRHASASHVSIRLEQTDEDLLLAISDDGVGFDPAPVLANMRQGTSGGLLSMHERLLLCDGRLTIDSSPGHGTTLSAWVPLQAGAAGPAAAPTEGKHGSDSHPAGR